jgi:hypothetical protein
MIIYIIFEEFYQKILKKKKIEKRKILLEKKLKQFKTVFMILHLEIWLKKKWKIL